MHATSRTTSENEKIVLCIQAGTFVVLSPSYRGARPNSGVLKYEWNIERDVIFAVSWQPTSTSIASKNRNTRNLQYGSVCCRRAHFLPLQVPSMRNVRRRLRDKQNNSGVYCCFDGRFTDGDGLRFETACRQNDRPHNSRGTHIRFPPESTTFLRPPRFRSPSRERIVACGGPRCRRFVAHRRHAAAPIYCALPRPPASSPRIFLHRHYPPSSLSYISHRFLPPFSNSDGRAIFSTSASISFFFLLFRTSILLPFLYFSLSLYFAFFFFFFPSLLPICTII